MTNTAPNELITTSEEYRIRSAKVDRLRELGIEPWPSTYPPITASCSEITAQYDAGTTQSCNVAGRLLRIRLHGKTAFAHLQDTSGVVQIYLKADLLGDSSFSLFTHYIDIGDIVWCEGVPFTTHSGEITLRVSKWQLLSKCLHPLPEKFHGIHDIEVKYRQRYLDLISSPESRERFLRRSRLISAIRSFLDVREYVEVETPMLHPIAGGATARPFTTHHNTLNEDLYLRIAPELYLKRLVIGGLERVYEINRNFRNEGISTKHNPEFTMLELYTAYQDYTYAMNLVEELLRSAALAADATLQLPYSDHLLDFAAPFRRMTMRAALMEYGDCTEYDLSPEKIDTFYIRHHIPPHAGTSYGHKLVALFEKIVEPHLIQPTFIHEFPVEVSPLAKRSEGDTQFVPRFELFIAGMEISNGYNELNDPFDQAARFKEQLTLHAAGDAEAHQYDADYITALEYALPPTVGIGIGIDRVTMILTNTPSIKEVILFPTLRRSHAKIISTE